MNSLTPYPIPPDHKPLTPSNVIDVSAPCVDSAILDLVFVADSSRSVGVADFRSEMKFIADIAALFRVAPNQSRIGLVTFQTYATTRFTLSQ